MNHKQLMVKAARAAGKIVRQHFREGLSESVKADDSPVTAADLAAEKAILDILSKKPYAVIAEESGKTHADSEYAWVIDPIDGTSNFSHGIPLTCIAIGLLHNGVPVEGVVYDAVGDELFYGGPGGVERNGKPYAATRLKTPYIIYDPNIYAVDGRPFFSAIGEIGERMKVSTRALGTCVLSLTYVAIGRADAYIGAGQSPWDHAAPMAICRAAGLTMTDWEGAPMKVDAPCSLVAPPALHAKLLPFFKGKRPVFRKRS